MTHQIVALKTVLNTKISESIKSYVSFSTIDHIIKSPVPLASCLVGTVLFNM